MNDNKLFKESEVFQKERPTKLTDTQETKFFLDMAKEIIDNGWSDSEPKSIADDLAGLYLSSNGYEMAKEMESGYGYYDINTEFCEWLEGLDYERRKIIEKNVKSWVIAHDIKPQYTKGFKLKLSANLGMSFKAGDIVFITGIRKYLAKYVIHSNIDYKGGFLYPYESVEPIAEIIT